MACVSTIQIFILAYSLATNTFPKFHSWFCGQFNNVKILTRSIGLSVPVYFSSYITFYHETVEDYMLMY